MQTLESHSPPLSVGKSTNETIGQILWAPITPEEVLARIEDDYAGEQFAPETDAHPSLEKVAVEFVQHPTLENFQALKARVRGGSR